eukprot:213799_1
MNNHSTQKKRHTDSSAKGASSKGTTNTTSNEFNNGMKHRFHHDSNRTSPNAAAIDVHRHDTMQHIHQLIILYTKKKKKMHQPLNHITIILRIALAFLDGNSNTNHKHI